MAQEIAAVTFKEYGLQDGNTLEATQSMLESRVVDRFPLNDQEILCRHLHHVAARVGRGLPERRRRPMRSLLPAEFSDLEPFAAKWCRATEHERYEERLASSMDEMQAFYDAAFPRARGRDGVLDQFPLDELPDDATNLLHLLYSLVKVSFPVEAWHQPLRPRRRRRLPRPRRGAHAVSERVSAYGYAKPAEGSWTEHYPELGTAPISYEDSISPEFYELEREAIFKRAWLNVGRVEQLPRNGQLLHQGAGGREARRSSSCAARTARCARSTTSAATAATSSCGRTSRARRRAGRCRQFVCKYHGWQYDLDGALHLRAAGERVLRPRQGRLRARSPVHCDVWAGFIFVQPRPRTGADADASSSGRWSPRSTATRSTR